MRTLPILLAATALTAGAAFAQSSGSGASTNPPAAEGASGGTTAAPAPAPAAGTAGKGAAATSNDANGSADTGNNNGGGNNAVNGTGNTGSSVNASGTINMVPMAQLQKGANSFTQGQARSRIESAGFSNVTDLKTDDQGIWRGKAQKDGKTVNVGFDFKGNLAAE